MVQTFTSKEYAYLQVLKERNLRNNFKNQTLPLNKPMTVEERKLRSRIRNKCKLYMNELTLAQLCGLIPDKKMRKSNIETIHKALDILSWHYIIEAAKEGKLGKGQSEG